MTALSSRLDALARLAKAATPGPWEAENAVRARGGWIKGTTGEWAALSCGNTDDSARSNAAYIAAANPSAILALIGEVRDLLGRGK